MSLCQPLLTARSAMSSDQDAQGFVWLGLANLQERKKMAPPPWITTAELSSWVKKNVFPSVHLESLLIQFMLIVPHPPAMHCCEKPCCLFSKQLMGTYISKAVCSPG